jgi:nuclear pore complex protein Nup62
MHVCVYACKYTFMKGRMHACMNVPINASMHDVCIHVGSACMYLCTYVRMYMCVYVCMCSCMLVSMCVYRFLNVTLTSSDPQSLYFSVNSLSFQVATTQNTTS